jgi:hypothetical protein
MESSQAVAGDGERPAQQEKEKRNCDIEKIEHFLFSDYRWERVEVLSGA